MPVGRMVKGIHQVMHHLRRCNNLECFVNSWILFRLSSEFALNCRATTGLGGSPRKTAVRSMNNGLMRNPHFFGDKLTPI